MIFNYDLWNYWLKLVIIVDKIIKKINCILIGIFIVVFEMDLY